MLNLLSGLAAFAVLAACCALALRLYRRGRPGTAALALAAAGLVLRAYAGADLFLHPWDERYHALVAKHLAAHPLLPTLYDRALLPYDYRNWRANGVWLHKPPLALWLMAASLRLCGVNDWTLRLPSVLLSTLAILLTYDLGRRLFDAGTGLVAAGLQAVHGYLIALAAGRVPVDHVDSTLIFAVELGVWLTVVAIDRRQLADLAVGAVTGLALLTKWLPGALIVPVWLTLLLARSRESDERAGGPRGPRERLAARAASPKERTQGPEASRRAAFPAAAVISGRLLLLLAVAAAVALPWQLYTRAAFPREAAWEAAYTSRHLLEPVEGLGGPPLFYLMNLPHYFGELVYLPLAWLAWQLAKRREIAALAPLAVWILVPYLVFTLAATKMIAYVFTAAPAILLVTARFWTWLAARAATSERGGPWLRPWVRRAVLALLLLLPLVATVARVKPWPDYERSPAWAREIRALPARLGPGRIVLFNLAHPLEAMFYTPYVAYRKPPTPEQARQLRDGGWRVVVLDRGDLPAALAAEPGVERLASAVPLGHDKPEDELPLPPGP